MRRVMVLVAALVLLLAACGGDDEGAAGSGTSNDTDDGQQQQADATVALESTDLGDVLAGPDGMTLYMFVPDQEKNGKPTCYEDCAEAWPPLEADGDPVAGEGIDQALLGTAERKDGTQQVTYNDLPLYYFAQDEAVGDTNGQGLSDVWWVMDAEGNPVQN